MDIKTICLIGCGGTGAMMLEALVPAYHVTMYDGDDYEEHNITRQIHSRIGENKATALADIYSNAPNKPIGIPEFVKGSEDISDIDLIVCCVDTNSGREAAKMLADEHDIPLVICGNENWDPMAWLHLPELEMTNANPFTRHGLTELVEGRQVTCAGLEVIQEQPQLPAANFTAGAFAFIIIQSLVMNLKVKNYIAEVRSTPWPVETIFVKDLIKTT